MPSALTVYRASAGSGKTFTLAVDFITKMLRHEYNPYRNMLAVTFTNKATQEMKERIISQLYGIAHQLPSSKAYLDIVMARADIDEATAQRRAAAAIRSIVHDYSHFRVETIDSFFQRILTDLAYEMNLPANFQLNLNDDDVLREAVERLLLNLHPTTEEFKWILAYISERIQGNTRWDIAGQLRDFGRQIFKENYLVHETHLRDFLDSNEKINDYQQQLRQIKNNALQSLAEKATAFETLRKALTVDYKQFCFGSDIEKYIKRCLNGEAMTEEPASNRIQAFCTEAAAWLRKADQNNGELRAAAELLSPQLAHIERLRMELSALYISAEATLKNLYPLRLLGVINSLVAELNREHNHFMLGKVAILLNRLNGESDASFVFEKSGIRFQHIMIDEFQDTSRLQWKNFKNLFIENMAAGNDSMLVGDGKQSIYRFRGGDWTILQNINEDLGQQKADITTLNTNYRSEYEVISFNNVFFPIAARLLDSLSEKEWHKGKITDLYADVAQQVAVHKAECKRGFVQVKLIDENELESDYTTYILEELETTIDDLYNQGVAYEKMAVLLRNNKEANLIVNHFNDKRPDLPFISNEAFFLSASTAVNIIISTLQYLDNPDNAIALAYVTKQYVEDIKQEAFDTTLQNNQLKDLLPEDFEELITLLPQIPLYEVLEQIISLFSLHTYEGEAAYLFAFLDEALNYLDSRPSSIEEFLDYWERALCNKPIPANISQGITVLTIHKSKGLEYDTVLIPFCKWKTEKDMTSFGKGQYDWYEPRGKYFDRLPVVPISPSSKLSHSIYADDYHNEHFLQRVDNLNLLYVAFTRASKNLLIWGGYKPSSKGELKQDSVSVLLKQALEEINPDFTGVYRAGQIYVHEGTKKEKENNNRLLPILDKTEVKFEQLKSRINFVQSNLAKDFIEAREKTPNNNEYVLMGNLVHLVLANISTADDVAPMLNSFEQKGYLGDYIDKAALHALIAEGLKNNVVSQWFDGSWKLYKECSIIAKDEEGRLIKKRPDRVMMKENEIVVVDFKFGQPDKQHHLQVGEYMALIRQMGVAQPVKGFLWYINLNRVDPIEE